MLIYQRDGKVHAVIQQSIYLGVFTITGSSDKNQGIPSFPSWKFNDLQAVKSVMLSECYKLFETLPHEYRISDMYLP